MFSDAEVFYDGDQPSAGEVAAAQDERQLTLEWIYPSVADMAAERERSERPYRSWLTHVTPVAGETWPEDLISLRAICVEAEYLFGLLVSYADHHKAASDATAFMALQRAAFQLLYGLETASQPHLDGWRRARDRARQGLRGTHIRVAHPDCEGEWVDAVVAQIQTSDIIASLPGIGSRGLRHVDWAVVHPLDRQRLEVAR